MPNVKHFTFHFSTRGGYLGQVQVSGANSIISCKTIPEITQNVLQLHTTLHS